MIRSISCMGITKAEITVKKKTFENSHKNSAISYWNLQECEGKEEGNGQKKRPRMEDVVKP